jgi:hypothetical protein
MRPWVALAFAVSVAWALPGAAEADGGRCPPHGRTAVRADRWVVVYDQTETHAGGSPEEAFWTCTRASGHRARLGPKETCSSSPQAGECFGIGNLSLAGRVVAYSFTESAGSPEGSSAVNRVRARDLRTGRSVLDLPSGAPESSPPGETGIGPVYGVEAAPDGAVAWMVEDEAVGHRCEEFAPCPDIEIHVHDGRGTRMIAKGVIRIGSLRRHGTRVTWTQRGRERSYTLG